MAFSCLCFGDPDSILFLSLLRQRQFIVHLFRKFTKKILIFNTIHDSISLAALTGFCQSWMIFPGVL